MLVPIRNLASRPRRLVLLALLILGGLVIVLITCSLVGGESDPPGVAPDNGLGGLSVAEQVAATVAAQAPAATLTPTPDVPATLVMAAEQTRMARPTQSALVGSGSLFGAGAVPRATPLPSPAPFTAPLFNRSDELLLNSLGPPVWYSVRLHLEMESLFVHSPDQLLAGAGQVLVDQAAFDSNRLARELKLLDQYWESVSPGVRDYGRYVEGTVRLMQDAVADFRGMYEIYERGAVSSYVQLSEEDRRDIEALYWQVKGNLNNFNSRMQEFGCSACGELYRGRSGVR